MSRDAGQVSGRQALVGGLAVALVLAAVIAGAGALLQPARPLPDIAPPARTAPPEPCPMAGETLPRAPVRSLPSGPLPVTSEDLIECPTAFDGREVVYEGEVVRAVLRRGDRAWVHLNDDPYALAAGPLPAHRVTLGSNTGIAVAIPAADAERITFVGAARARGDRLRVHGTFLRTHPADAGGPAIEAQAVEITAVGEPLALQVTPARVVVALLLAFAAAVMTRIARRPEHR